MRPLLVLALLLVPLGVLGAAAPASAVGCHGSTCNGQDPKVMGCVADAVTVNRVVWEDHASGGTFGKQVVALKYSAACDAAWALVNATAGGTAAVTRSVAYMGGYRTSTKVAKAGPGVVQSKMRTGTSFNACGRTVYNAGAVVEEQCATAG